MLEKKKMSDGTDSLVLYFVQNEDTRREARELELAIDEFVTKYNIKIDGYREFEASLPIDPTTLKPKNKYTDGFKKYKDGKVYEVSY